MKNHFLNFNHLSRDIIEKLRCLALSWMKHDSSKLSRPLFGIKTSRIDTETVVVVSNKLFDVTWQDQKIWENV